MLDGVKAWRAEFKGVFDRIGDQVLIERLHKPQDLDELALAADAHPGFEETPQMQELLRQRPILQGPGLVERSGLPLDQRQIMQGIANKVAELIRSLVAGDLLAGADDDHLIHEAFYDDVAKAVRRGNRVVGRAVAIGNEQRKTGWMRAEAAGDPGPWRQQAILGRGRWEADDLRDIVRGYVLETLADDDAVLVFDETGFLKQGKASCGVARQYTGSAGKITNCQIGVFACYVSRHGHAFIDRSLYVPKGWTDDAARMKAAHVPEKTAFATKPALAVGMIERAIATAVPFAFVAADSVYGVAAVEGALRRAGKGYARPVSCGGLQRPLIGMGWAQSL